MTYLRKIIVWQYLVKCEFHRTIFNDSTPFMSAVFTGALPFAFLSLAIHVVLYNVYNVYNWIFITNEIYLVAISTLLLLVYKFICRQDEEFKLEQVHVKNMITDNLKVLVWSFDAACFLILIFSLYFTQHFR